jgi:hypothetical protein
MKLSYLSTLFARLGHEPGSKHGQTYHPRMAQRLQIDALDFHAAIVRSLPLVVALSLLLVVF